MASLKKFKIFSLAILFFFSFQILGLPTLAQATAAATAAAPTNSPLIDLGNKIKSLSQTLRNIQEALTQGLDQTDQLIMAQAQSAELLALRGPAEAKLAEIEATLQSANPPQPFLDRHNSFVAKTKEGFTQLQGIAANLDSLIARSNILPEDLEPLIVALDALVPPPAGAIIGSHTKLPIRRTNIAKRQLAPQPAIIPGTIPVGPGDLAATPEVRFTPEIQALVTQLDADPVAIFAYVRNNIDYQPYFGSIKGSQGTYWEKAGNDMDQASLLIALLRAANYPARYVSGMVELPIDQVMNWTGAKTPQAAVEIISSNGIPHEVFAGTDGAITHLRLLHTWVAASFHRVHNNGHFGHVRWVQLDPSFKSFDYMAGVDIKQAMGFDLNSFYSAATEGANINQTQSYVTKLNETNIKANLDGYAANLQVWVSANLPNATVGDVLGCRKIVPIPAAELKSLKRTFTIDNFVPQYEYTELPASWRYQVSFQMPGFTYATSMPELYGQRLALTYVPATWYDQYVIDFWGGIYKVFAYLVHMKPQLKLEGQIVAEGSGLTFGSYQLLRCSFLRPLDTDWDFTDKQALTGSDYSLSLDYQRTSYDLLQQRMDNFKNMVAALPPDTVTQEVVDEALHLTGMCYYVEYDGLSLMAAQASGISVTKEPFLAFVSRDYQFSYFFSIPWLVQGHTLSIDIPRLPLNPVSTTGQNKAEADWMLASGSIASSTEHAIFEQLYCLEAVSTEKILALANRQGIPIYEINPNNINQILPTLTILPIAKQHIQDNVLNHGRIAVVPKQNIRLNQWQGAGWIVLDPSTGSAGYMIAGSLVTGNEITTGGGALANLLNSLNNILSHLPELADKMKIILGLLAAIGYGMGPAIAASFQMIELMGAATCGLQFFAYFGVAGLAALAAVTIGIVAVELFIKYWYANLICIRRWYAFNGYKPSFMT